MENKKKFLKAEDVSEVLEVSIPMAYKIIRRLNDELNTMGYITVSGRVSRSFFETKFYGTLSA